MNIKQSFGSMSFNNGEIGNNGTSNFQGNAQMSAKNMKSVTAGNESVQI